MPLASVSGRVQHPRDRLPPLELPHAKRSDSLGRQQRLVPHHVGDGGESACFEAFTLLHRADTSECLGQLPRGSCRRQRRRRWRHR
jgi:hypothetical protein